LEAGGFRLRWGTDVVMICPNGDEIVTGAELDLQISSVNLQAFFYSLPELFRNCCQPGIVVSLRG